MLQKNLLLFEISFFNKCFKKRIERGVVGYLGTEFHLSIYLRGVTEVGGGWVIIYPLECIHSSVKPQLHLQCI